MITPIVSKSVIQYLYQFVLAKKPISRFQICTRRSLQVKSKGAYSQDFINQTFGPARKEGKQVARSLFLADGLSMPAFFEFPSSLLYVLCTSTLYHRDIHKYQVYRIFTDKMFVCADSLQGVPHLYGLNYHIVARRSTSQLVTPHVTD